ncbi:MAG: N-6 DNA methylase [Phycisphaerae bacterium]
MVAQNSLISQVQTNLKRCGYSNDLLRPDYVYEDNTGKQTIALAGFAKPVYDSRTSCVSVVQCNELLGTTEKYVNQYRGFGAPVIFVCCNGMLQWWNIGTSGAKLKETISKNNINSFFSSHKKDFLPDRIWRAKNLGRVDISQQLSFVDIGLMPLLEHEMGERLGGLMKRVIGQLRNGFGDKQLEQPQNQRWIFRAAFWLLCAKILKDKRVRGFLGLNLGDVESVLKAVENHYRAQEPVNVRTKQQAQSLEEAAEQIKQFADLNNLTTEAFAYMYENVLVDKKLRSALGIHATPSYLVDYIVWQLWPWIEQIPQEKRVVLEPTCGHAPFLTGAMRLLRELFKGDEKAFHDYAKKQLIGVETDSFALEIARLSLTMADVPNPNGWDIVQSDIFKSDILRKKAEKAMILLCNPPFEDFTPEEQLTCRKADQKLNSFNKAAEMLWRTLPYMQEGSVFGIILPRGFLDKQNITNLRKMIVNDFEIQQICNLPKGVFSYANHEAVVICGRKLYLTTKTVSINKNDILYRRVFKDRLKQFCEKYEAQDQIIPQTQFMKNPTYTLKVIELGEIWDYCINHYPKLGSIADGGQGLIYKGEEDLPKGAKTYDKKKFTGAVRGYALFNDDIKLHGLPDKYWMNLSKNVIRRPLWGTETGKAQILINYAPVSEGPWRLKILIDSKGYPINGRFLIFRLKNTNWSLNALWAILNGPLANAFIFTHTTDRDIAKGIASKIPIPSCSESDIERLNELVEKYFGLMTKLDSGFTSDILDKAKQLFLLIDAEVLRLYDLPPKMEKRILNLFQSKPRKGVDFDFKGYYPEGFESAVPLHEYLSEEYQRSTITFADEWVRKHQSPEINKVLCAATEAFEEKAKDA